MSRNLSPKCKQCRRQGAKLFLKGDKCSSAKCAIIKRNFPPGAHGPKGARRSTEYGQQLREKQKAKRIYGVLEKQFNNYYKKALKQRGDTGKLIVQILELRLDNVIYRLGLAKSRALGRQMVRHGFFLINNKKVDIPSLTVKVKDEITFKPQKSETKLVSELTPEQLEKREIPVWLHLDSKELKARILAKPQIEQPEFNPRLIVEFYSR